MWLWEYALWLTNIASTEAVSLLTVWYVLLMPFLPYHITHIPVCCVFWGFFFWGGGGGGAYFLFCLLHRVSCLFTLYENSMVMCKQFLFAERYFLVQPFHPDIPLHHILLLLLAGSRQWLQQHRMVRMTQEWWDWEGKWWWGWSVKRPYDRIILSFANIHTAMVYHCHNSHYSDLSFAIIHTIMICHCQHSYNNDLSFACFHIAMICRCHHSRNSDLSFAIIHTMICHCQHSHNSDSSFASIHTTVICHLPAFTQQWFVICQHSHNNDLSFASIHTTVICHYQHSHNWFVIANIHTTVALS